MSTLTKKLHVRFEDDVDTEATSKKKLNDEMIGTNGVAVKTAPLNYSRDMLYELGKSAAAKVIPKVIEEFNTVDEKRKEKIKIVFKNFNALLEKKTKNGTLVRTLTDDVAKSNTAAHTTSSQQRTDFQQLMAAAVSNTQPKIEHCEPDTRRRRIGSGRFVDNYARESNNNKHLPIGMDYRNMGNELFKDDAKSGGKSRDYARNDNWKNGNTYNWESARMANRFKGHDNADDAKSDENEPEWGSVPVSKNDIIELHGFDGPEDEKSKETVTDGTSSSASPPARSTPSKMMFKSNNKSEENFNFEDFLKLEMGNNGARNSETKESRFTQWFNRDGSANQANAAGNLFDMRQLTGPNFNNGSTQKFFDYHNKSHPKRMGNASHSGHASGKFRNVDDLEANLCPNAQTKFNDKKTTDLNTIRTLLSQIAMQATPTQQASTLNALQSSYLLNLINKSAESLYQQSLAQNLAMKRPDAQLLLHRLINCEITYLHLLQQINNPNVHPNDRETLIAVLNFCNANQAWLHEQQQQTLKHKSLMSARFRQLQLNMKNQQPARSPTPQELQMHTQAIMQNAMLKKKFEEQYRKTQSPKPMYHPKTQQFSRFNQKHKMHPSGENGLQFIQSQSKAFAGRNLASPNGLPNNGGGMRNPTKFSMGPLTGTMQTEHALPLDAGLVNVEK